MFFELSHCLSCGYSRVNLSWMECFDNQPWAKREKTCPLLKPDARMNNKAKFLCTNSLHFESTKLALTFW